MEHEEIYDEALVASVKTRRQINEVYWPQMKLLSKRFCYFTKVPDKWFKLAKDMIYYQGGYPAPTSPPKIETLVENFAITCKILQFLGKNDQLLELLELHGIEVKVLDSIINPSKKEAVKIIEDACDLQREICASANVIKKEHASHVKEACGIKKGHFISNVRIAVKQDKDKSIENDFSKFNADIESAVEVKTKIEASI